MKLSLHNSDCLEVLRGMQDNSVDLVVADPPYFKVVGEKWDYQWRTEVEYLKWCISWLEEIHRVLRVGGTMYMFGYFRILGLLLSELRGIGFSIRQQIVIDKGMKAVAGRATKKYRMFPCVTESILFLTKDNIYFSRNLLKSRQMELGLSSSEINNALGVKSNGGGMWSIYTGKNVCEQFPTKEVWEKLQAILKFDIPYEKVAQTFNPEMGITDVWRDIDFFERGRIHPTQKPLKLIERLVKCSSNEGDVVLDPFMGSGTTGVAAKNLGRDFIGIELDSAYFEAAKRRIEEGEKHDGQQEKD
jgi:site-specific DNA-methyltransferase (adenine-specific)